MTNEERGPEELETAQVDSAAEEATSDTMNGIITNQEEETASAITPETEIVSSSEPDEEFVSATDDEDEHEEMEAAPEMAGETPAPEATSSVPYRRGQLVEGKISKTSPLEIRVELADGIEGVIPGRELERMTRNMLEAFEVGQDITVFVVNPNDHQGRVIISINRALEELDWQTAEEYRQKQTVYEGNVAGYNKGGLIVRFGRLRGFVPQSQIGDHRRRGADGQTPEEMYGEMVNDTIYVKVMEVDRSRNRLILSERAASREQREQRKAALIEELNVGQIREGRVVSLEDFGAFVDVGGAEGLVHLTEISWRHVTHPRDVLKVGQTVRVEVISVDPNRKRIGLSIKRQEADPWDEVATTYQPDDLVQGVITKLTKFGAFAQLVDAEEIEGLIHISELSDQRVNHPREVVKEGEVMTLRVVKIDVANRRLGLSLKRVQSTEYLDHDMQTFAEESEE